MLTETFNSVTMSLDIGVERPMEGLGWLNLLGLPGMATVAAAPIY